ncbi:hypothetical protein [Treponema sp. J25]|jgi:hypothetical protein|uniref:hypothetical protein n=1 Tax=Treponema sp. J25 TaxID=2094121 RepID=UPI001045D5ED|nr:hypothetical protein [Treponema sp. J25]TCW60688.1 hypothetical protein C5O22_10105 [Treponema sp. J25]
MKRIVIALIAALILVENNGFSQNRSGNLAEKTVYSVDFSKTLEDFGRITKTLDDSWVSKSTAYILDGTIGSVIVRNDSETSFLAEVELLGGKWKDEETVELFRAYVLFEDPQFRQYFIAGSSQRLRIGQHILVLVEYQGLGTDYDAVTPIAVLRCRMLRPL